MINGIDRLAMWIATRSSDAGCQKQSRRHLISSAKGIAAAIVGTAAAAKFGLEGTEAAKQKAAGDCCRRGCGSCRFSDSCVKINPVQCACRTCCQDECGYRCGPSHTRSC